MRPAATSCNSVGSPFFDYTVGEAHPYGTPEQPLIQSWRRHAVFAKPNYIVIFDDVQSADDIPREYNWILNVTCAHAIAQKGEFVIDGDTLMALPELNPHRPTRRQSAPPHRLHRRIGNLG